VIIFKSCFPSSNIDSDERLEDYHRYYLSIRDVMDQHPDKIFIPWTTPPLVPNETTPENAARARQWAAYLISDEYLSGHPNVFVFDIFSLLADEDGFLRAEYRSDEWDSHPNEVANQAAAPVLADLIHTAITTYAPTAAPEVEVQEPEGQVAEPEILEPEASNRIEDFESTDFADRWWMYADVGDAAQVCTLGEPPFSGTYALQLTIDLPAEKYAGCGISFDEPQDRSQMDGVAFFWFSNDPGLLVGISVWVYDPTDPENPTPFYTERRTPTSEWTAVIFGWDELTRAEWVGETGVMEFDPSQIIGVSFDAGHWEEPQKGTVWIDDLYFYQEVADCSLCGFHRH
jgi:hypothetical protein